MTVPFFPYAKVWSHYPEAQEAMRKTAEQGHFILGPELEEFEQNFAKYLGVKHVVGLNSGTDALLLALAAADVGPGDEIITVSHTFIATIQVIKHLGATPVLVDIGEDGLMDWDQVWDKLSDKTKAVIPVYLEGNTSNVHNIPINVPLIRDTCQALGVSGLGHYSLADCYSFYPAKILGCFGDGGAVATNDDNFAEEIRRLRHHYFIHKGVRLEKYQFGYNSRLDNIQASVLSEKLKYLDRDIARRQEIAGQYYEAFEGLPGLILPPRTSGRVYQDYVIRVKDSKALAEHCKKHGVEVAGVGLLPNHLHPGLGLDHFKLPKTEEYLRMQVRLPCNQFMSDEEVSYVAETVRGFYG